MGMPPFSVCVQHTFVLFSIFVFLFDSLRGKQISIRNGQCFLRCSDQPLRSTFTISTYFSIFRNRTALSRFGGKKRGKQAIYVSLSLQLRFQDLLSSRRGDFLSHSLG